MRYNLSKSSMRKIISQLVKEKSNLFLQNQQLIKKVKMLEAEISDLQRDSMLEDFYCGGDEIGF